MYPNSFHPSERFGHPRPYHNPGHGPMPGGPGPNYGGPNFAAPHQGGPYGPPQGGPYGPPQGGPYGPPQGGPYGQPQGGPYGPPQGGPFGPPHGDPYGPAHGDPYGPPQGGPYGPPQGGFGPPGPFGPQGPGYGPQGPYHPGAYGGPPAWDPNQPPYSGPLLEMPPLGAHPNPGPHGQPQSMYQPQPGHDERRDMGEKNAVSGRREVRLEERTESPKRTVKVRTPSPEPAKKKQATLAKRLRPSTEKMTLGDEYKDPRLDDLFLHSNGYLYPVYSRNPDKNIQLVCNLCNSTCTSYKNMVDHMVGTKHKLSAEGGEQVESNLKLRLTSIYEFPEADKKEKPSESQNDKPDSAEGEKEVIPADIYDFKGGPLIGLEYVVELKDENFAECTLCGKFGNLRTVVNHLKGPVHRLAYMEQYFPTVHAKFSKVPVKNWRSSCFTALNEVVEKIEKVQGRLRHTTLAKEEFEKNGTMIREKLGRAKHLMECRDTQFHDLPDPFAFTEDTKQGPRKSRFSDSPPVQHKPSQGEMAPGPMGHPGYSPQVGHPSYGGPMQMGGPFWDPNQGYGQMMPPHGMPGAQAYPGQSYPHQGQPGVGINMTITPPEVVSEIAAAPVRYDGGGMTLASIGQSLKTGREIEIEMIKKRDQAQREAREASGVTPKDAGKDAGKAAEAKTEAAADSAAKDESQTDKGETLETNMDITDDAEAEKEKKKRDLMAKLTALREEMTRDTAVDSFYKKAKEQKAEDPLGIDDDDLPEMEVEVISKPDVEEKKDKPEAPKARGVQMLRKKPFTKSKYAINIKLGNKEHKRDEEPRERVSKRRSRSRSKTPRRYVPPPRTSPVRPVSKRDLWDRMQRELKVIHETQKRKLEFLEKRPEDHPKYAEEWKTFWERRYKELKAEGEDPTNYDFKPEWIVHWNERVKQIDEEEMMTKKDELVRKYGLEGYEPENDRPDKRARHEPRREEVPKIVSRIDAGVVRNPSPPPSSRKESQYRPRRRSRSPKVRRSRSPIRRRSPSPVRRRSPTPVQQGPVTVLSVVRMMSALENQLGSLAPAINSVLSRAVAIERTVERGSDQLLEDNGVVNTLEMAKEKLTGQLAAGLIESNAIKATRNVIDQVTLLSSRASAVQASPRAASSVVTSILSAAPVVPTVVVEKEKPLDKHYLAHFIAYTLITHGKDNITEEALHNLIINALPGLNVHVAPELKIEPPRPAAPAPPPAPAPTPAPPLPLFPSAVNIGAESKSFMSNSFEDDDVKPRSLSEVKREQKPEVKVEPEMLGDFSLEELKTLISNFRNLTPTEQKDLVTYMKRLETTHPDKVKKLREAMVPASKEKRSKPRTPSPFHVKKRAVLQEGANPAPPSPGKTQEEKPAVKAEQPTPSGSVKSTPPEKPRRGISLNLDDFGRTSRSQPAESVKKEEPPTLQQSSAPQQPLAPHQPLAPQQPPAQNEAVSAATAQAQAFGTYQTLAAYNQWLAAGYITPEQYQQHMTAYASALVNPAGKAGWPNYRMPGQ